MIKFSRDRTIFSNIIDSEINYISMYIHNQSIFSRQLLSIINYLSYKNDTNLFEYIKYASEKLDKINSNILNFTELKFSLEKILVEKCTLKQRKIFVNNYNKAKYKIMKNIFPYNVSTKKFIESFIYEKDFINISFFENSIEYYQKYSDLKENTLIISEIDKVVKLPFRIKDLENTLKAEPAKYSSVYEVIAKNYTIPISYYRFSAFSRFRETYKLVTEKEHASKKKAIPLSLEMFANYNLHPAIITACKNLDELDIYLSCLEDNKLEDFNLFDIKFIGLPTIRTNSIDNFIKLKLSKSRDYKGENI